MPRTTLSMTDSEYREFLTALVRRHFRAWRTHRYGPGGGEAELSHLIETLSYVARLSRVVADRSHNLKNNQKLLCKVLADDLRKVSYMGSLFGVMRHTGLLDALDEQPRLVFKNLRRSAIPDEDAQLLGRCGVENPEAEITILIAYCRSELDPDRCRLADVEEGAMSALKDVASQLESFASDEAVGQSTSTTSGPKTKLFNGVGRILTGAVTGAGNLLLATGSVVAPNPAIAYGVLGSTALAIGSIFQGIGDIRGE